MSDLGSTRQWTSRRTAEPAAADTDPDDTDPDHADPDHADPDDADPDQAGTHVSVEQARDSALRRLAHAPRTRAQLLAGLLDRGVAPDVAATALDSLADVGLVDDDAFARAWVDSRARSRGLSRSRLRRELIERGIDDDLADAAVADLDAATDAESAQALADRWTARTPVVGDRDRRRLVGYLVRRGHSPSLAARLARDSPRTLDSP